tara:strand:- start:22244 stop:23626 length:1383 start_codon:yes stop_codon:yes gene_type:complete
MISELTKRVSESEVPSHSLPSDIDIVIACISLLLFGDYRASLRQRTFNYHIGAGGIESSEGAFFAEICELQRKDKRRWYAHEMFLGIAPDFKHEAQEAVCKVLAFTPKKHLKKRNESAAFNFLREAVFYGCDEIFDFIVPCFQKRWGVELSKDKNNDVTKLSSMRVNITVNNYLMSEHVSLLPHLSHNVNYWDALMLSLAGSERFSRKIRDALWQQKNEYLGDDYTSTSLKMASWNYRIGIFLLSKKYYTPILTKDDIVIYQGGKEVDEKDSSVYHFSPLVYTWAVDMANQLICSHLSSALDDGKGRRQIEKEIKEHSVEFKDTIVSATSGIENIFFTALNIATKKKCVYSLPEDEVQSLFLSAIHSLHRLIADEALISEYKCEDVAFIRSVIKNCETQSKGWLIKYYLDRKESKFWIEKTNTKRQLQRVMSIFKYDYYEALSQNLCDNTKSRLLELICD